MSSHNERVAATRQQACVDFTQITSTNLSTAKHYLQRTAFDLERAVSLFYESGGAPLPSDDEGEDASDGRQSDQTQENAAAAANNDADDGDPISAIMSAARREAPTKTSPPATSFGGQGFSLNSPSASESDSASHRSHEASPSTIQVRVTFYRDGFTDQEEKEEGEKRQREAGSRRQGVHSFASSPSSAPRLPPKRSYDVNAQFIRDVQESRVPLEYRRLDKKNRPVPVSILLDDQRKRDYPVEIWHEQQRREQSTAGHFSGVGQTLGGGSRDSSSSSASNGEHNSGNNHNLGAWLLTLLFSWWNMLHVLVARWLRRLTAASPEKHVVDHRRATTAISLRMPHRQRARVDFNTEHTVGDLRRYCRLELEGTAEKDLELLAGFPPKIVRPEQDAATLEEAGLLNSAVDVRVLSNPKDKRRN